jgi:hypothetical protein
MCRKLVLSGWVLLISEKAEQARVLVALFVSIAFLAMRFSLRPLKRCATLPTQAQSSSVALAPLCCPLCRSEDAVLATLNDLVLVLLYQCAGPQDLQSVAGRLQQLRLRRLRQRCGFGHLFYYLR